LNNLLSNAIKFTPEGGRIKMQVRRIKSGAESQDSLAQPHFREPMLEPKTRIESEIMADLQEFAKQKPRTKTHDLSR
jgi:hypothetical protein